MNRRKFLTLFGIALLSFSAEARGQFSGGTGGGGLAGLLAIDEVKKELDVSQDQEKEIAEALKINREDQREAFREAMGGSGFGVLRNMSEEDQQRMTDKIRKSMSKITEKSDKKIQNILLAPQIERLEELLIQQLGVDSLTHSLVAKRIGLKKDQARKLKRIQEKSQDELMKTVRGMFAGGRIGGDLRKKLQEKTEEFKSKKEKDMFAVLTSSQKKKFEKAKGKEFKFPKRRGAFSGPARRNRSESKGGGRPESDK